MNARVLKKFRDKHTGTVYKAGEIISISEERFEEILTVGKLVEVAAEADDENADDADQEESVEAVAEEVVEAVAEEVVEAVAEEVVEEKTASSAVTEDSKKKSKKATTKTAK